MSPRANTIIKSKKRVVSFAGKNTSCRHIDEAAVSPGGETGDDGDADGDDDSDAGGDADDDGSSDKPRPKSRRREPLPVGTSPLFTVQQSATYLNCSPQLLDKLRHKGGGPAFVRVGNDLIRYTKADLDRYIAKRTFKNTAQAALE